MSLYEDKNSPFVSIIILNYNKRTLLVKCLQSVLDFTKYPSYEIVVTDNGSIDGSIEEVKRVFCGIERIKVVVLGENFGYAEGNNKGFNNVCKRSKYVVILNNDVTIDQENWLSVLVEFLDKHEDIGIAQPIIVDSDDSARTYQAKVYGFDMNVFGEFFAVKISDQPDPNSNKDYNECFSVLGAAFIARKKIIDKIGLFNKRFFLDYEDSDFCWRVRLFGSKPVVVHSSRVRHLNGGTINSFYLTSPILQFHILKNKIYMLLMNYELTNVIKYVPWTILSQVYDLTNRMISSLFARGIAKKILKSMGLAGPMSLAYLLIHFPEIWNDRLNVQENIRKVRDSEIVGKYIRLQRPLLLRRTKPPGAIG